ncbi:UbiA family prenyltransferase [Rhizobium mongolense]|uniref:4-hydroxybenzoate polyprenyltransferase n=1 Tax=Rhizobium mongolense TaxID=57676 RepID=A0A7W6RSE2_9HYPH|nr:UbiA family prenyltransferase [Rhizobium mongolense]MBB4277737.1 4-hydroxybenzoate polyprenyltransferase [Rhizobium mongolense]
MSDPHLLKFCDEMNRLGLDGFDPQLPLVCDLDGTLIKSDSLYENFFELFFHSPQRLLCAIPSWFKGRAALKEALANACPIKPQALPYRAEILELMQGAKAEGRRTYLVTAADQSIADNIVSHLGGFDGAKGSDGALNLRSRNKLKWLQDSFPDGFIYAGDSSADLPIWMAASGAVLVGNGIRYAHQLREAGIKVRTIVPEKGNWVKDWLLELRIHQWSKNVLMFIPLFLGHIAGDFCSVLRTLIAFVTFGLIVSASYILNDLADLDADRAHTTKRFRPIAAGRIGVRVGFSVSMFLLAAGFATALILHPQFALSASVYLMLTLAYSLKLKRYAMLDVTIIGALFTLRIVMGQVLNDLAFSPWLLSFSAMFFFSLSMAKRHVEAMRACAKGKEVIKCRGYLSDDWPTHSKLWHCLWFSLNHRPVAFPRARVRSGTRISSSSLALYCADRRILMAAEDLASKPSHGFARRPCCLRAQRQDQLIYRLRRCVGVYAGFVRLVTCDRRSR